MKKYKPKTSTINKTKQKKRDVILYRSFMTAIAVFVLYHIFIESHYFGSDYRYNLYVFWIPTLIGFFITLKFILSQIESDSILLFDRIFFPQNTQKLHNIESAISNYSDIRGIYFLYILTSLIHLYL